MGPGHHQRFGIARGKLREAHHVETGAEGFPLPRKHNGADISLDQLVTGADNGLGHLRIDGIHLVRTGQGDAGDMVVDLDGHAAHGILLGWGHESGNPSKLPAERQGTTRSTARIMPSDLS